MTAMSTLTVTRVASRDGYPGEPLARQAVGSIEALIRAFVREEVLRHFGSPIAKVVVRDAAMSMREPDQVADRDRGCGGPIARSAVAWFAMPTAPPEPSDAAYIFRKALLQQLVATAIDDVVADLLRAAFDRYRIQAWCGNETRGATDAIGILERVLRSQTLDDQLREVVTLTIESMKSLTASDRLKVLTWKREGLVPEDWNPA